MGEDDVWAGRGSCRRTTGTLTPERSLHARDRVRRPLPARQFEDDYEFGFELLKRFSHIIVERLEATGLQLLTPARTTPDAGG